MGTHSTYTDQWVTYRATAKQWVEGRLEQRLDCAWVEKDSFLIKTMCLIVISHWFNSTDFSGVIPDLYCCALTFRLLWRSVYMYNDCFPESSSSVCVVREMPENGEVNVTQLLKYNPELCSLCWHFNYLRINLKMECTSFSSSNLC